MKTYVIVGIIGLASLGLSGGARADSFKNLSEAASDSAKASGRLTAAGLNVAFGAVAVPLALAGAGAESSGKATREIGKGFWEAANAPLEIDETIAVAQPLPHVPRTPNVSEEKKEE